MFDNFFFYNGRPNAKILTGIEHMLLQDPVTKDLLPTIFVGGQQNGKPRRGTTKVPSLLDSMPKFDRFRVFSGAVEPQAITGGESRLVMVEAKQDDGNYFLVRNGFFNREKVGYLGDLMELQKLGAKFVTNAAFPFNAQRFSMTLASAATDPVANAIREEGTKAEAETLFSNTQSGQLPVLGIPLYRHDFIKMPWDSEVFGRGLIGNLYRMVSEKKGIRFVDVPTPINKVHDYFDDVYEADLEFRKLQAAKRHKATAEAAG